MSWPALAARALRVAGALRRLGVRRDDRVAIVYPTGFEFLEALFGVMSAGAVPVPVYPPGHLGRLDEYHARTSRTLTLAGARLVLADRLVRLVLGETIARAVPPLGCLSLDGLPEGAAPHAWPAADLALIQFSSGTTGDPRPVALSQRAVAAQVGLLNRFWQDDEATTHSGLSWLPLYHDMGLIGAVLTALARPATITLIPPEIFIARPAVWLRAISDYGATISPSPTFGYARCTERIRDEEMHGVDLSRWRVALCGGEQAVPAVLRAFASRFSRWGFSPEALSPVYGLAEATLAVTFSDLTRPFVARRFEREALAIDGRAVEADRGVEIASVGRPLPGFAVRIVGDRRRVLADGRVGVIECRGPSIMDGYFQQPESTARILRDGWLDTGDLGFVQGGELYVTGRAKDMLLIRGRNHAPDEVERAVEGVPGVRAGRAVAVSWLPEGASGELLYVFVEARVGVPAAQFDEVARLAAEAIVSATGLSPERVIVVASGTLPRTTSGKLRRREALRRHLDGALAAPSAVTPAGLVGAVTRSWLAYRRSARR
jgi:acyl-CoA synthetase (AMP-forming)/AMP-acid ligase II